MALYQSISNLKIFAGMDGDTMKGVEARGGTKEGPIPLGHVYAAWVGVKAGEDEILERRVLSTVSIARIEEKVA